MNEPNLTLLPREEDPDIEALDLSGLEDYLDTLRGRLEDLDAREPAARDGEAREAWEDDHEDLEDLIDEVLDRMDDLRS